MKAFNNTQMEQYKAEAKERWGSSQAYREYEEKTQNHSAGKMESMAEELNAIFADFAACKAAGHTPNSTEALALVQYLQQYITQNYYTCTNEILAGLGQMYVMDQRFADNINTHGDGTADFAAHAIKHYCNG